MEVQRPLSPREAAAKPHCALWQAPGELEKNLHSLPMFAIVLQRCNDEKLTFRATPIQVRRYETRRRRSSEPTRLYADSLNGQCGFLCVSDRFGTS